MESHSYQTVLVGQEKGVATVTLNRPDRLNSFNHQQNVDLADALIRLDRLDDVRCIVVTGAGRAFCAGVDLDGGLPQGGEDEKAQRRARTMSTLRTWEMRTPIIAAINGAAVGMGLTYAMCWDIRIVAEDAKLGFVFTRRGLTPEGNSLWLLPRLVGASVALELLITGRMFSGREAFEMGLVTRAVPSDEVLPTSIELAHEIAEQTAPASVAITKKLFYRFLANNDRRSAKAEELEMFRWVLEQADAAEGMAAFREKRLPRWTDVGVDDLPAGLR